MARIPYSEKAKTSNYEITENGALVVRNAWLPYKNFSAAPTKVNPQGGKIGFSLLIDEPVARELISMGWNIKEKEGEEGEDNYFITDVIVNPDSKWPPVFLLFTEFNGKKSSRTIERDEFGKIDRGFNIKRIDLVVSLARGGGRYLQEIRITERPQRSYFRDDEYAEYYDYDEEDCE